MRDEVIPTVVDEALVLYFTRIDEQHVPTHACKHIVEGRELRDVWGLVIGQYPNEAGYYLFRCGVDYIPLTDTWHKTVEDAFGQAEFEYAGAAKTWSQPPGRGDNR